MRTTVSKEPDGARDCAHRTGKKNPGSLFSQEEKNNERILVLILISIEMVELCIWKVDNITKKLVRATCVRVSAKRPRRFMRCLMVVTTRASKRRLTERLRHDICEAWL